MLDGVGAARFANDVAFAPLASGPGTVEVELTAENGERWTVSGHYRAYDHLSGGWLFVPRGEREPVAATVVVDGVRMSASR